MLQDSSLHPIHLDGVGGCRSGAGLGAQAIRRRQQVAPLRGNHHNCDVLTVGCLQNWLLKLSTKIRASIQFAVYSRTHTQ